MDNIVQTLPGKYQVLQPGDGTRYLAFHARVKEGAFVYLGGEHFGGSVLVPFHTALGFLRHLEMGKTLEESLSVGHILGKLPKSSNRWSAAITILYAAIVIWGDPENPEHIAMIGHVHQGIHSGDLDLAYPVIDKLLAASCRA